MRRSLLIVPGELNPEEQTELLKLLEHDEVIEPPTIVFTVTHIGSNKPPSALPPIYATWWRGREWWNALPIAKRRELVAKEHATQGKR
jgi:hypothetical protein